MEQKVSASEKLAVIDGKADDQAHAVNMGNWTLNTLNTTMVIEALSQLPDISSVRLACGLFAKLGRLPQWKLRLKILEQSIIHQINSNYPPEMIKALGGVEFIARLPIINIERVLKLATPDKELNYIEPVHFGEHSVIRGVNIQGQHFIAFNVLDISTSHRFVIILFQKEPGDRTHWKATTSSLSMLSNMFADFCLKVPQNLSFLLNTLTHRPIEMWCSENTDDLLRNEIKQHRLKLITSHRATPEQIQRDFPDFIIEALGLQFLEQLLPLPLGDRQSKEGKINFINCREQDQRVLFGWDINQKWFICFSLELQTEVGVKPFTLCLYKGISGECIEYSAVFFEIQNSLTPVLKEMVCVIGEDLINPNYACDYKVKILQDLMGHQNYPENFLEFRSLSEGVETQKIRRVNHHLFGQIFTIDPSPFVRYQQYITDNLLFAPMTKEDNVDEKKSGNQKSCICF